MGILVQAPCHLDTAKYPISLGSWNPMSMSTSSANLQQASKSQPQGDGHGKHDNGRASGANRTLGVRMKTRSYGSSYESERDGERREGRNANLEKRTGRAT